MLIKLDTQITTGHKMKSIKCIHQYQDHIMTDDDFKVFCRQCKAEFELMPTKDDEPMTYKITPIDGGEVMYRTMAEQFELVGLTQEHLNELARSMGYKID